MSRGKNERKALELEFQRENDLPEAVCIGWFYNQKMGEKEECSCRDKCDKYLNHLKSKGSPETYFDLPRVNFYYIDNFRKCKFKKVVN